MPASSLLRPLLLPVLGLILLPNVGSGDETRRIGSCTLEPGTRCTHLAAELKYKDLKHLDLRNSDFSHTSFHGSSLDGSDLRGATLVNAEFDMGSLSGADLRGADLTDAFMSLSRMHRVDLRGATLFNVDLRYAEGAASARLEGARLCNTRLPGGELSHRDCPN
ncbi:pentapeptide repeat-containing protein [Halomonas mongoliensis]|uniref:pentapeptide repeat-containing protein n=1 Tax=Halomonas mongoliensis TaxID=321265 RepID=UPI00403B03A0